MSRGDEIKVRQRPRSDSLPGQVGRPAGGGLSEAAHPSVKAASQGEVSKTRMTKADLPANAQLQQVAKFTAEGGFTEGKTREANATKIRQGSAAVSPRAETGDTVDKAIGAAKTREKVDIARAFPYPGKSKEQAPGILDVAPLMDTPDDSWMPDYDNLQPVATARPTPKSVQPVAKHTYTPVQPGAGMSLPPGFPGAPKPGAAKADTENTPAKRLEHIEKHHQSYAKEYKLQLVHRLLLRGLPLDVIADMTGMTMRSVQLYRNELQDRLREEARHVDIYGLAGQSMAFYNEVRAMSMRIASEPEKTVPAATRIHALRTALQAEADKHRFLQASGFYETARYMPDTSRDGDEDEQTSLGQTVLAMLADLMDPNSEGAGIPATPSAATPIDEDPGADVVRLL